MHPQNNPNTDQSIDESDVVYVDSTRDTKALEENTEGWDDLSVLKDELAHTLLSFVIDIERITSSPEVLQALGERTAEFNKTLDVFYNDINRFSNTIEELRLQHIGLTGGVTTIEDLNLFTRLSMGYQTLQIELQSLLGPTMANIVLMLHEVAPTKMAVQDITDTAS